MVNAARFVDTLDTMSDPFLKDINRQLLSDETLHAQFGFFYLDEWSDWIDENAEVRSSIGRYLEHGFAIFEREYSGTSAPARELTDDERALGLPDRARLIEIFYGTVEGAILPGLERYGSPRASLAEPERAAEHMIHQRLPSAAGWYCTRRNVVSLPRP